MQNLNQETISKLQELAQKYETPSFIKDDPSQFLHKFQNQQDTEIISFISAMLSFGNREQFIKKIQYICNLTNNSPYQWIKNKSYKTNFLEKDKSPSSAFYRFYTFQDIITLFDELSEILEKSDSLGEFIKSQYHTKIQAEPNILLDQIISASFPKSKIVPKGKNSANKRINMFLRWMVRQNSPVDKGYWTWYSPENLIIPLDTHVLQQSKNLGLISENASNSRKTALEISKKLTSIFPQDPTKGDFALFGLGVNSLSNTN